jgi:SAM-dependent methyltransferase
MWDKRYGEPGYAYGTEPNDFLAEHVREIPAGPVLCLGDGEGRNGVFLASRGLSVTAVDSSAVGLQKARELAETRGVSIQTVHADLEQFDIGTGRWAGIVEIFCHLPAGLRATVHQRVVDGLRPGGVFLLEAYTPEQLELRTGGPPMRDRLYQLAPVLESLGGLDIRRAETLVRPIHEGRYHHGQGAVMQVVAVKPTPPTAP